MKAILYCTTAGLDVANRGDELAAQERLLVEEATALGYHYEVIREDSDHEDGPDRLAEALDLLDRHQAQVLMAVREEYLGDPARLTALMGRSSSKGWGILVSGRRLGAGNHAGESPIAKFAAELNKVSVSDRTREAMAKLKSEGTIFGRRIDSAFIGTYRDVLAMVDRGESYNGIARKLNAEGIATAAGGKWYASTIKGIVDSEAAKRIRAEDAS